MHTKASAQIVSFGCYVQNSYIYIDAMIIFLDFRPQAICVNTFGLFVYSFMYYYCAVCKLTLYSLNK